MVKKESKKQELEILKEDFEDLKKYLDELREILPVSICTLSSFLVVVDINKTAETLTGYAPLEIIGRHVRMLFSPQEETTELFEEAQKEGGIKERETALITKNKEKILVSISISLRKDFGGNPIGYFLTITDISKTKKYQKQLEKYARELEGAKESLETKVRGRTKKLKDLTGKLEEKVKERTEELRRGAAELEKSRTALMNILEDVEEARIKAEEEKNKTLSIITNFTDGILAFDQDKILSLINPQAESILRVSRENLLGKSISELKIYQKLTPIVILLEKELKGIYRKELTLRKDISLEISTVPMGSGEEEMGTLVILHDITREKMVERIKTEFVSLAAHQLRTPLSAIKWTLRMLLDGDLGEITKPQKEMMEKSYQSNERMIALINDLLNVTRIEEGRYIYKPVLAQLEDIAQFVVNSFDEEIKKKDIKFEYKKPRGKLPKVKVDVEKVRLVINNLLNNAIRYTSPQGKIALSLKTNEDELELTVKDTGVGIPKDQQKRIFTKFFRGSNVIKMDTEGSGLGLFISKNIIEAHGGRMWFESEEGEGTTFHFTLPRKKEFAEFLQQF